MSARTETTTQALIAAGIGVLGAVGNVVFRHAIAVSNAAFGALADALAGMSWVLGTGAPPIVLVVGALVLLVLDRLFPGHTLGYGFPRFLEMVHLEGARVNKRWMIVKTLGSAIALGAGASVGREGPIAQIGGSIGSAVSQMLRVSADRAKLFVACGAAAGIAATFNAPIAGVMFAQEILLQGEVQLGHFSQIVIATATAVIASHAMAGSETVFHTVTFELASYRELLTYALMGLTLGLLAVAYLRFFHWVLARAAALRLGTAPKLVLGLAFVGVVGIFLEGNLSDGYPTINAAFAGQLPWSLMAALALAKMVTSSVSLASGAPGGVFGPIFFIGTMSGGTFRGLSDLVLPDFTGPRGSYALVGFGTFLAACTHAPLTAIFLLCEMTGSYEIALPALVTSILAVMVASTIEPESIDTLGLARAGKNLRPPREQLMDLIPVSAAFHRDFHSIAADAHVADVLRVMSETRATSFPVLDASGRLVGTISMHEVRPLLTDSGGRDVVIAADLCNRNVPRVTIESSLGQALGRMETDNVEEIPVVDEGATDRVIGLLSRADVIRTYNQTLLTVRTVPGSPGTGELPQWSKAYRVTTLPVPEDWYGRSLRDLDCRARFGVSVLAVQAHDKPGQTFEVPDPDRVLAPGESLVIAGPAAQVERFERTARSWALP